MKAALALPLLAAVLSVAAQPAAPGAAASAAAGRTLQPLSAASADTPSRAGEPAVRYTVIEDDAARIDEVRVRGVTTRIVVSPKGRGAAYEILTGDGSRDLSDGANTSRGAAGKRVWRVLDF